MIQEKRIIPLPSVSDADGEPFIFVRNHSNDSANQRELEQYSRHLSLQGFGPQCQDRLKKSSVLVIGAGGLGCPALQYLTAAGVGKIGIMDDDVIEISNLQRQVLFSHQDRGKNKARIAASRLSALNPYIEITAYPESFQ